MGLLDSLFGSNDAGSAGTPDFVKRTSWAPFQLIGSEFLGPDFNYDAWTDQNWKDKLDQFSVDNLTPYEGYSAADRYAPTPQEFLNAQAYAGQVADDPTGLSGNPLQHQARGLLDQATTFDQGMLDNYMNPYTTNVIDELYRIGGEKLHEVLLPGVNTTFTGAGQFGSSRHEDFTNRAIRDTQREVLGQSANVLMQGQNEAFKNYADMQDRQVGAAGNLSQMPGQQAIADTNYLNNLLRTGEMMRMEDQRLLDWDYQEWYNEQNRYRDFLDQWTGSGGNMNNSMTYSNQPSTNPGILGTLAGVAMTGAGIYGMTQ